MAAVWSVEVYSVYRCGLWMLHFKVSALRQRPPEGKLLRWEPKIEEERGAASAVRMPDGVVSTEVDNWRWRWLEAS